MDKRGEIQNPYLTDSVKSPGLLLLGRARKLPSNPRSINKTSASMPEIFGWNHLEEEYIIAATVKLTLFITVSKTVK
jgi:hypothetical protein